jgi:hypothetical protein
MTGCCIASILPSGKDQHTHDDDDDDDDDDLWLSLRGPVGVCRFRNYYETKSLLRNLIEVLRRRNSQLDGLLLYRTTVHRKTRTNIEGHFGLDRETPGL